MLSSSDQKIRIIYCNRGIKIFIKDIKIYCTKIYVASRDREDTTLIYFFNFLITTLNHIYGTSFYMNNFHNQVTKSLIVKILFMLKY